MEYDLDVDVAHVIEWLKKEAASSRELLFDVTASRSFVSEATGERVADINEDDDLNELSAVGILEVKPKPDSGRNWLIRIRVEDIVGPHLPEEGSVPEEPEEMTLAGFEEDFVLPDRGTIFATVEFENERDHTSFNRFMNDLETDRHEFG